MIIASKISVKTKTVFGNKNILVFHFEEKSVDTTLTESSPDCNKSPNLSFYELIFFLLTNTVVQEESCVTEVLISVALQNCFHSY